MEDVLKDILLKMRDIHYGWVDKNKQTHTHSKKDFFLENYRFMSVEDTLKYKHGTCFEQSELIRYYLNNENIKCNNYIIIYNDDNKIASHTVCIAESNSSYYLMEPSWIINNDKFKYDSKEEILNLIISLYPKMYKIEPFKKDLIDIFEYDAPKPNITFKEFQEYTRSCKKIEL